MTPQHRLGGEPITRALREHPELAAALRDAGERRRRLRREARDELDRILALARKATALGANLTEISDLTGVSRSTMYPLLRDNVVTTEATETGGKRQTRRGPQTR